MYMDVYHDPAPSYIFVKARNDLPLDPEFERILRYTINNELVEYHVRVARGEKPEDIRSKSQTRHQDQILNQLWLEGGILEDGDPISGWESRTGSSSIAANWKLRIQLCFHSSRNLISRYQQE